MRERLRMALSCVLLMSISSIVNGQDDCKKMLTDVIAKMQKVEGTSLAMTYTIHTKVTNGDDEDSALDISDMAVSILIAGNKSKFISDDMELFKDDLLQVTVMKEEQKIYVMQSIGIQGKDVQKQVLGMLQDSLLNWLVVTNCETICDAKDKNWSFEKIETKMKTTYLIESTGIDQVNYWIDRKNNRVSRIQILYNAHPYGVSEIDLSVSKFETNFKGDAFKGSAYDMVFSSKNVLLPKYKEFGVIDYRKR